MFTTKRM